MKDVNKRLTVLSELEEFAFYGFPDFDDEQRSIYFVFEKKEWELISIGTSLHMKVACALQIGYFKAKKSFWSFSLHKVPKEDLDFILSRYFPEQSLKIFHLTKYEYYFQREAICKLFGYKFWSQELFCQLKERSKLSVKRDISPYFIARELLDFLQIQKIVRPGYSTLQKIIRQTLIEERNRLKGCLQKHLIASDRDKLKQLIKKENTLSELAALKQDAKNFKLSMVRLEIKKHDILKPLHEVAVEILPHLDISQQNIAHYASLIHHYTIYELDNFEVEQTYLYLLCYVLKRYQQINDNLVEAFDFNLKRLETVTKAKDQSTQDQENHDKKVGQLILLFVDDKLKDVIHQKPFEILPKESIRAIGEKLVKKPNRKLEPQWQERDKAALQYIHNLRPLLMKIDFESSIPNNPLLEAIQWMKEVFTKKQTLSHQPFNNFPYGLVSRRLEPYLLTTDNKGNSVINANRFEILVYQQISKQMTTGALFVKDSIRYRPFITDLVSLKEKKGILKDLKIPWLEDSCKKQVNELLKELETLWIEFNTKLKQGQIKHLKHNSITKKLIWVKPKLIRVENTSQTQTLYDKLPLTDVADVLRFVHEKTGFLSAFTPVQPRYSKKELDIDTLIASLISQGMGIGNHKMAQTSDASYSILEDIYQQYLRLSNLQTSSTLVSNAATQLDIFPPLYV